MTADAEPADTAEEKEEKEEGEDEGGSGAPSFDYEQLLSRARDGLPEYTRERSRFTVPKADVLYEGKTTVLRNFQEIVSQLNREPDHLFGFLLREFGTAGSIDGRRAIFKSSIPKRKLNSRLKNYVETWVLCSECRRPDTHLIKEGRTMVLECDACGGHRPVKVRKRFRREQTESVVEGNVYDLQIIDIGKKGDGVAKRGAYVIFVPQTTKGQRVKAKINKIHGTKGFASLVHE